jgi:YggT family protein
VEIVCVALQVYGWVLLVRILLSWAQMFAWNPPGALAPAIRVVYDLTEPVLGFIRRYVPPLGGFDLSPLFIFFALSIVRNALGC